MPTIKVPENQYKFGFDSVEALAGNHLNAEEFLFDRDGVLRSVYWEKPGDVDMTIDLVTNIDPADPGATVRLVDSPGADGKTSGAAGAGRPVLGNVTPTGSKLVITTANGSAGTKRVTIVVSSADVGV